MIDSTKKRNEQNDNVVEFLNLVDSWVFSLFFDDQQTLLESDATLADNTPNNDTYSCCC